MKNTKRILCLALILVTLFTLVACSSFGGIKSNFEKNGYTYIKADENDTTTKAITAELEKGEISCTVHAFSKNGTILPSIALVLEFGSDKELQKAISEDGSETLKGLIKDAQNSEYVNGNCILFPLSILNADEMKEIFNK